MGIMRFFRAGVDGVAHEERSEKHAVWDSDRKEYVTMREERRKTVRRNNRRREKDRRKKFGEAAEAAVDAGTGVSEPALGEAVAVPPDSPGCILTRLDKRIKKLNQESIDLEALRFQIELVQLSKHTPTGMGHDGAPRFPKAQPGTAAERALHRLLDGVEELDD